MGYKIGKVETVKEGPEFVEHFYNHAFIQLNSVYCQIEHVPEALKKSFWKIKITEDGFIVEPTQNTRKILEDREIISSFWEGCVVETIQRILDLDLSMCLLNEDGDEIWMWDDTHESPWRRPAPMPSSILFGTVVSK